MEIDEAGIPMSAILESMKKHADAIHYLEEIQKKGNFTAAEKRRQWRRLVEQMYLKISVPDETETSSKSDDMTPVS